ncbi:hypothetical protein K474DRAFT_1586794 [Panus rudis PR-1116 ss-1]|nr:hypothetical protein K474DRAFT_1586794 [Panus rudis PR-1116 ss-1]
MQLEVGRSHTQKYTTYGEILSPSIQTIYSLYFTYGPGLIHSLTDPLVAPPESEKTELEPKPLSPPLRPLTSLKWPYIPEESAYEDPLKRDDPKPLQLHQYESIATSPAIREVIAANPRLRDILRSIDQLHGEDRQEALQRALGVSSADVRPPGIPDEEDIQALRRLAEAVEAAVRGGKHDVLGLDWGD